MMRILKSFGYAVNGLRTTWREENNFKIEVMATFVVLFSAIYFDFNFVESVSCAVAVTLVLIAEIINTAIEDLCNFVEPEQNPTIAKIKDTSGAFVLVTVLGALVIGALVFYNHFQF